MLASTSGSGSVKGSSEAKHTGAELRDARTRPRMPDEARPRTPERGQFVVITNIDLVLRKRVAWSMRGLQLWVPKHWFTQRLLLDATFARCPKPQWSDTAWCEPGHVTNKCVVPGNSHHFSSIFISFVANLNSKCWLALPF